MSATTDNVGVRVFSDLSDTLAKVSVRDGGFGICLPVPGPEEADMPFDEPFGVDLANPDDVARFPVGTVARDTLNQIALSGAVATIIFVRAQEDADLDLQYSKIAGVPADRTGMFAFLNSQATLKMEPAFLLAPGYGDQSVVEAMDTVSSLIVDCMGVFDSLATSVTDAIADAAKYKTSRNIICCYPQVIVDLGAGDVVRPLSTHVAAEHLIKDASVGNVFKAAWNRNLKGVQNTSVPVQYWDGGTTHDANKLNQAGVVTVIEGDLLWGPYTTATDPTTVGYRSIKRIRTRRAVEKAYLKALRKFNAEDIGPHELSLIYRSMADFLDDLVTLGAVIDYTLVWSKSLNPASLLEAGGIRVKMRFAETPDLTDLMLYSEPQPEAFDVLSDRIGAALTALGNDNIRVEA